MGYKVDRLDEVVKLREELDECLREGSESLSDNASLNCTVSNVAPMDDEVSRPTTESSTFELPFNWLFGTCFSLIRWL